jgi:hypothetical protein
MTILITDLDQATDPMAAPVGWATFLGEMLNRVFPSSSGGVPPVVSNLTPTAMSTVARNQQHEFDFTDDGPFRTIVVAAKYPSGRWDLIYDGDDFNPDYASSSITPIVGGFHLSIARDDGWLELGALKLMVKGIDQTGEENT